MLYSWYRGDFIHMTKPEVAVLETPVEEINPITAAVYTHSKRKPGRRKGTLHPFWNSRQQQVLLLTIKGYDNQTIAKKVGLSLPAVSNIKKADIFTTKINAFQARLNEKIIEKISTSIVAEQVRNLFAKNALPSARRIVRMTKKGENAQKLQLDACREVLYQIGIKPIDVVEQVKREYTPQEIQSALVTLQEIELMTKRLELKPSQFLITEGGLTPAVSQPTQETSGITTEQTSTTG